MTVPPVRAFDLAGCRSIAIPKSAQILPTGRSRAGQSAGTGPARGSDDAEVRDVGRAQGLGIGATAARPKQAG
jgi:hypothetical protein